MKPLIRPLHTVTAAVALCAALASCSLLHGPAAPKGEVQQAEPAAPSAAAPVATHRFEIDPETDDIVGIVQTTMSSEDDTLSDIARRFNIGYEEIVRANPGVDPWLPGARLIVLPTRFILPNAPREGIVINVAAMRLYYFPKRKPGEKQQVVYTHPIGIGKVGWRTPEGVTKVMRKQKDPTWRPTPSIIKEHRKNGEELDPVIGPGPDNPLGAYAMYLGWKSYLIHGTNKPYGVGLRSSHGCMRLYPEDIELLFENVPVGTPVRVVNQPFVFGWDADQLYLQAYDVLEDDPRDWKKAQKNLISKSLATRIRKQLKERNEEMNWEVVSALAHEPRGIPVPISLPGASLDLVLAQALQVENRVPEGATWDGKSNLPVDENVFNEMLSNSPTGAAQAQGAAGTKPSAQSLPAAERPDPATQSNARKAGG